MTEDTRKSGDEALPLATENQDMPQDETVSEFGEMRAKRREIAIEAVEDPESGGVAEQRAYLRREARISDEEREERADRADINNAPNFQTRD